MLRNSRVRYGSALALLAVGVVVSLWVLVINPDGGSAEARQSTTAGSTIPASDAGSFAAALATAQPGDTIELSDGSYPRLEIRGASSLTVSGSRETRLAGIEIQDSMDLTLTGVTITPPAEEAAIVKVVSSQRVTIDGILLDGRDQYVGASIVSYDSVSDLSIQESEITNCGERNRCIASRGSTNVTVRNNAFHDCLGCDFIRGGSGMTIDQNSFDRAIPGSCSGGSLSCNHNDHIQILGGGPWIVTRNHFGEKQGGAAGIFVSPGNDNSDNPIHDVLIASNIFVDNQGNFAIKIGDRKIELIDGVVITNNTVLAGDIAGIAIKAGWEGAPQSRYPVVANNIIAINRWPRVCERGIFVANLTERGARCAHDFKAPARLSAAGEPTKNSKAILNRANPAYAPDTDYFGRTRNGPPDIGAIEFRTESNA